MVGEIVIQPTNGNIHVMFFAAGGTVSCGTLDSVFGDDKLKEIESVQTGFCLIIPITFIVNPF